MGDQPGLEGSFVKNRRRGLGELKHVVGVGNPGIELGAAVPMIKAAVVEGLDFPMGHFIRTSPGHTAGGDGNALGFAGGQQSAGILDRALDVLTAANGADTIGKAQLKIHHQQCGTLTKTYASLAIAGLFKLIHNLFPPQLTCQCGEACQYDVGCTDNSREQPT